MIIFCLFQQIFILKKYYVAIVSIISLLGRLVALLKEKEKKKKT